ncbi:hypothetical protein GCM10020331_050520 [Ectobacillus funiculus]
MEIGRFVIPIQSQAAGDFSNINTINPDVDDSIAVLRAMRVFATEQDPYHESWDRGINWVISMQNDDGGWPAFERNANKPFLTWLPLEGGEDILMDPSTADITGRTLQFLGDCTLLNKNHQIIKRGVDWLLNNQKKKMAPGMDNGEAVIFTERGLL